VDNYLLGIALLMMFFQVDASTGQQPGEDGATYQAPELSPIWIQDPYTSDSVLTSYISEPDTSLWNATRITDYIRVPIYNGTDHVTLDRGVGRIKGMAKMDEDGNLGISGHRDGFFRGLKDIEVGDDIKIQTTRGTENYAVTSITIIDKSDISILKPTTEKTLTIVTCYPFYFVGHAPKRYIVHASPIKTLAE
jgi:LPXTG-site transpeptidase (sortase) family protein